MINKNNLVFLIFVLFIIPNIYSAINITVLEKPTLTLELVEGGSLTENTRYYFSGYNHINSTQSGDSVSPAADQVYIDTNTTHKSIKITWGEIPSPAIEMAIKWDTIPLIDENGEFIPDRKTSNLKYLTAPSVGFTGTETIMTNEIFVGSTGAWSHPELSVPIEDIDPKINRKKGICHIEVTETHTYDEFVTAIRNSDANDLVIINRDDIILPCAIYGSGKIEFNEKNITFLYSNSFNTKLEFNNSQIHFISPRQSVNINFKLNNSTILPSDTSLSSISISGILGKNNLIYFSNFSFNLKTYNSISDVILTNNRINFRYPRNNWYFNNSIINNGYVYQSPHISYNKADVYYINTVWNNKDTDQIYDLIIGDTSYYKNKEDDFYQNIYLINSKSDREDKLPIVRFDDLDNSSNLIDIRLFVLKTISFKIKDQQGKPIEKAIIEIDNGIKKHRLITGPTGLADQNIETHRITYKSQLEGGGENRTNIEDYSNYKITVTAEGYSTYVTTQKIDDSEEYVITLPNSSFKIGASTEINGKIIGYSGVVDELRIYKGIKEPEIFEIEYINQRELEIFSGIDNCEAADNAKLLAWINVPKVYGNRDTPIYMYFGNQTANESNDSDTWDDNYKTVMHFNEILVNNEEIYRESTNNSSNGKIKNFDFNDSSNTGVTGKIGYAPLLDGIDDYIEIKQPSIGDNITYSHWINKKFTDSRRATKAGGGTGTSEYLLRYTGSDFGVYLGGGTPTPGYHNTTNAEIKPNDWIYITWSYDKSQLKLYVDGDLKRTVAVSRDTGIGNNPLNLGLHYGCAPPTCYENFLGNFDELRISNTIRSDEWIKTEYNNQSDPQSFINVGMLEKS